MNMDYPGLIEAILFASGQPMHINKIAVVLSLDKAAARQQLLLLKDKYKGQGFGIQLVELNDHYQLCTKPEYADYVKEAIAVSRETPLSQAAMEVIAIIAYNQPVTKGFIEEIRGVNSSQIVNTLVDKGLIEEAGRLNVPGRPVTYKTTLNFLRSFGLTSLEELPDIPKDMDQLRFEDIISAEQPQTEQPEVEQPEFELPEDEAPREKDLS